MLNGEQIGMCFERNVLLQFVCVSAYAWDS